MNDTVPVPRKLLEHLHEIAWCARREHIDDWAPAVTVSVTETLREAKELLRQEASK